MKVKDVPQIAESPTFLTRNRFPKYIEIPCLEACLKLYDLNIKTFSSGCNKINYDNAHIQIDYQSLSEENKKIVEELIRNNLATKEFYNNMEYVTIFTKTNLNDDVHDVSNKLLEIVKLFAYQDVLYGFISLEEFKKQAAEMSMEFRYVDGELIPYNESSYADLDELEDAKREVLFYVEEQVQDAIDEGRVDLENGIVWENSELFNKHITYVDEMRGLKKK